MIAVVDTNVLVSALWRPHGNPAAIVDLILTGDVRPCYDSRIMAEYRDVLSRPKFGFPPQAVDALLKWIEMSGLSVVPKPLSLPFNDEDDLKFFEMAKFCDAPLITGNARHFPQDPLVMSPAQFLETLA